MPHEQFFQWPYQRSSTPHAGFRVFNSKVHADKITIIKDKWARKSIVKTNNCWNIAYKVENNLELFIFT